MYICCWFLVFRVNNLWNNKYPQKQENLHNSYFFAVELWDDAGVKIFHSTTGGDDICHSLWNMAKTLISS